MAAPGTITKLSTANLSLNTLTKNPVPAYFTFKITDEAGVVAKYDFPTQAQAEQTKANAEKFGFTTTEIVAVHKVEAVG